MSFSSSLTFLIFFLAPWCQSKVTSKYDCGLRQSIVDLSHKLQPWLTNDQLQEIADGLNGAQEAQNCSVHPNPNWKVAQKRTPSFWKDQVHARYSESTIFVSPDGFDSNLGSFESPLQTIQQALRKSRSISARPARIILRGGTYYLSETIEFLPIDSDLILENFNGENAVISGAIPLKVDWKPYKVNSNMNIYVSQLGNQVTDIPGLRVNGKRAIRARYPNANPELDGFGSTLKTKWIPPTLPNTPDQEYNPSTPYRNTSISFQKYNLGIGGPCKGFTPPAGYWCGTDRSGGGPSMYTLPSGLTYTSKILPNTPYNNTNGGIIQAWRPAHWASWMFEIGEYDHSKQTIKFGRGGFQGARGNKNGEEFYVENIFEELDAPAEYYFNKDTKQLFFFNNVTNQKPPSQNDVFEATNKKILLKWQGTQSKPVRNVIVRGMTIRDSAYTYMDPHGMPSGGDWGLQKQGALNLEGTENIQIISNLLTKLDGNAVMVSGYNRKLVITRNEFSWIGDSAIAQWGDTVGAPQDKAMKMGWDGRDGNQPRGSTISFNYAHELGIWEKQSSFYFQAKSCENQLIGNIFFNGPRAGINFNDGFGGGSRLTRNILFNTCRESGDHGPFNSWDRQVYVADATEGVVKKYDEIDHNLFIVNYHAIHAVDNDDGSCYYSTHDNWFSYGPNELKSNFGGHDNHHFNNLFAYGNKHCFGIKTTQLDHHIDWFFNNTCALDVSAKAYGDFTCSNAQNEWPLLGNNTIWTRDAQESGLCGKNEQTFQKDYPQVDKGTKVSGWPANGDDILLEMGRRIVGL